VVWDGTHAHSVIHQSGSSAARVTTGVGVAWEVPPTTPEPTTPTPMATVAHVAIHRPTPLELHDIADSFLSRWQGVVTPGGLRAASQEFGGELRESVNQLRNKDEGLRWLAAEVNGDPAQPAPRR
jgi:hypothetical protein